MKLKRIALFYFLPVFFICCLTANAQNNKEKEEESLQNTLSHMFEHIDKNNVPTGLLRDAAEEYVDLDLFTGTVPLTENNSVDIIKYSYLLKTVQLADMKGGVSSVIQRYLENRNSESSESSISLGLALYEYSQISARALKDGLIKYENDQVYETGKNPYEQKYLFACCVLTDYTTMSTVELKLSRHNILTNQDIKKLEINMGNGFLEFSDNGVVKINLKSGTNDIILKATLANGDYLLSHTYIQKIESNVDLKTRGGSTQTLNPVSNSITINGNDYKDYLGISTSANIICSLAPGHLTIQKPFIIVEGFDPRISGYPSGFMSFQNNIQGDKNFELLRKMNGYDLIYVDWVKSGEYIQANAYTLIAVLNWINGCKAATSSTEKNVIMGHSMGGLVVRYALSIMEKEKIKHQTATYISYDAPHLGANVPLGVLYGYKAIREWCSDKDFIEWAIKQMSSVKLNINELIELGNSIAYSNSTAQMLVDYVTPQGVLDNSEHILWQKELSRMGFPKGDSGSPIQMLAIANGSYQEPNIPENYLAADGDLGVAILDFITPLNPFFYGLSLNDITAALVSLIPGKTSVDAKVLISPARKVGDMITNVYVKVKKRFLWIGPTITHTNFIFEKYYPNIPLYDTYPGSVYDINKTLKSDINGSVSDLIHVPSFLVQGEVAVRTAQIPFVATSSALAVGSGLENNPSIYFTAPKGMESAFGNNYFIRSQNETHAELAGEGLEWAVGRLQTAVVGSVNGYTGEKYTLSNSVAGGVSWSTSNPNIATISQDGILTVKGKGVCSVIASSGRESYSKLVVMGNPRYVIAGKYSPGGYSLKANCIDSEYKDVLETVGEPFKFKWGIKYGKNSIEWVESGSPEMLFSQLSNEEQCVCFLEVLNSKGERVSLQNMSLGSRDVYDTENTVFYLDAAGKLYDSYKSEYSFDYASVYFERKDNLSSEYLSREWDAILACSVDPGGRQTELTIDQNSVLVRDMVSKEALNFMRQNSVENQEYVYTLVFLNYDNRSIQFVPVKFIYQSKI